MKSRIPEISSHIKEAQERGSASASAAIAKKPVRFWRPTEEHSTKVADAFSAVNDRGLPQPSIFSKFLATASRVISKFS